MLYLRVLLYGFNASIFPFQKKKKIPYDCPILSDINFYTMYGGLSDILYYKLKAHFL